MKQKQLHHIEKLNTNGNIDTFKKLGLDRLKKFKLFQTAILKRRENERKRLVNFLGENHPRVKEIIKSRNYSQNFIKILDEEIDRISIYFPKIDKDTWMVYGRILDKNHKGIKGMTVGLADAQGKWIKELGFAETNEKGHFFVQYPQPKPESEGEGGESKPEEAGIEFKDQKFFLLILGSDEKVIYQDTFPLTIIPGRINYREIVLRDIEVQTPPPGVEKEAMIDPDVWRIRGRVKDQKSWPLSGLTVSVFDNDLIFKDKLGSSQTDEKGEFDFLYRIKNFSDLKEADPDIYIKISDQEGKELYTTKKASKFRAGHVDTYDIQIKASKGEKVEQKRPEDVTIPKEEVKKKKPSKGKGKK